MEAAMSPTTPTTCIIAALAASLSLVGCDEPAPDTAAPSASSPPSTAPVTTSTPTTTAAPKPVKKPSHPCPDGSKGDGTATKPCEATGTTRVMDVKWTGKIKDQGPSFRVTNKTKLEILYGKIYVYFYDKAGKQLEATYGDDKKPYRFCSGRIFAGPMKPKEKATLYFSCVKKKHVPEGTTSIEAEMKTVGFTAKDEARADTYWRNADLVPEKRPKGGVK